MANCRPNSMTETKGERVKVIKLRSRWVHSISSTASAFSSCMSTRKPSVTFDPSTRSSATEMNACSAPHLLGYTGIINLNLQQQQSIAPSPSVKRKSHFLLTRLLPESGEDEGRSALTRRRSCSRPAERLQGCPGWDRCNTVLPQRGCRG